MKEIAVIMGIFIAMMKLISGIGILIYTIEVTDDFNDKYDDIKNGDTVALVDFIENRASDLVNMTIDESQDIIVDTIYYELIEE